VSASNGLIVDAQQVSRVFSMPAGPVTAVRDVTLQIRGGDHVAVRGPSGCGKSTLLHMLGCVETQTSGTLLFDGQDVSRLSDARRSLLRLRQIGFVFQRFFLLPMLTARENVELPMSEAGITKEARQQRVRELPHQAQPETADRRVDERSGQGLRHVHLRIERRSRVLDREGRGVLVQKEIQVDVPTAAAIRVLRHVVEHLARTHVETEQGLLSHAVTHRELFQPRDGGADLRRRGRKRAAVTTKPVGHPLRLARADSTSAATPIS